MNLKYVNNTNFKLTADLYLRVDLLAHKFKKK